MNCSINGVPMLTLVAQAFRFHTSIMEYCNHQNALHLQHSVSSQKKPFVWEQSWCHSIHNALPPIDESVRVEVDETLTSETEPLIYLEEDLEAACQALDRLGYNGGSLWVSPRHHSENLLQRLPPEATREQKVKAVVQAGINLSSLFYQVGPTCLSTDMIFQAFESKSSSQLADYKKLWEDEWRDKEVEDIVLPPEPVAPLFREDSNTSLGRTVTKNLKKLYSCRKNCAER